MAGKIQFYRCPKCGTVVDCIVPGSVPSCCGAPMEELAAQTASPEENKHVPYIEKADGGVVVKVGKTAAHPMEADHYIVFIQICADGVMMRKYLGPGDSPEAFFATDASRIIAWEYCNKHGLWTFR